MIDKCWLRRDCADGDAPSTRVLDILEDKDVTATFFLIGEHVEALPELARRAALKHEIGNHTW